MSDIAKRSYCFDLKPEELAGLFQMKDWKYAKASGPDGTVMPKDVIGIIDHSVRGLAESGMGYAELGRFVVFKDSEFPGGYEICIKIGYVTLEGSPASEAMDGEGDDE